MNTVKRLKKSNSYLSQKKQFSSEKNNSRNPYIAAAFFASLIGTYLDLFFVGKEVYTFPARLFPEIFTINIAFTLFILPFFTILFLLILKQVPRIMRIAIIIFISIGACFIEYLSEQLGWFMHQQEWSHAYSFFGYMLFLITVWKLFCLLLPR